MMPDLAVGDVCIQLDQGAWLPLFPFITVHECAVCHNREFYFPDKWLGPGSTAHLKSFDQGHSLEKKEEGDELSKLHQESTKHLSGQ